LDRQREVLADLKRQEMEADMQEELRQVAQDTSAIKTNTEELLDINKRLERKMDTIADKLDGKNEEPDDKTTCLERLGALRNRKRILDNEGTYLKKYAKEAPDTPAILAVRAEKEAEHKRKEEEKAQKAAEKEAEESRKKDSKEKTDKLKQLKTQLKTAAKEQSKAEGELHKKSKGAASDAHKRRKLDLADADLARLKYAVQLAQDDVDAVPAPVAKAKARARVKASPKAKAAASNQTLLEPALEPQAPVGEPASAKAPPVSAEEPPASLEKADDAETSDSTSQADATAIPEGLE
jgi:anaerobic ribonucleoside-triphosphate reductase